MDETYFIGLIHSKFNLFLHQLQYIHIHKLQYNYRFMYVYLFDYFFFSRKYKPVLTNEPATNGEANKDKDKY